MSHPIQSEYIILIPSSVEWADFCFTLAHKYLLGNLIKLPYGESQEAACSNLECVVPQAKTSLAAKPRL